MSDKFREELLSSSTKWLLEMEMIHALREDRAEPTVHNFLYINIFNSSKHITHLEYAIDIHTKSMLIYIQLGFWGRFLKREKAVEVHILEELQNILPSFRFRVVFDKAIFDRGLTKAQQLAKSRI